MAAEEREAVIREANVRTNEENGVPNVADFATRIKTDSPVQNWSYISLSEESTVIKLIRTRSLVDTFWVARQYANPDPLSSDGVVSFAEDIFITYLDLDILISECGLTRDETELVTGLMNGITIRDLVEDKTYVCSADVFTALDVASRKIVEENNKRWKISVEMAHKRNCKKIIEERKRKIRGI